MKKLHYACIALGAFASVAHAQTSVTVFGIIDASVMSQSKTGPTGTAGRDIAFVDGSLLPSIYGIKGKEDLGGGLSAGFTLEGGFNSGNGGHNNQKIDGEIFGREAKVTLGGDWGTVGAGLQLDPGLIASILTEPRGLTNSFSHVDYWIVTTLGNNYPSGSLQGGIFDNNALTYTYAKNGLYVGLEYGFGGIAGSTSANSTKSIGVSYAVGGFAASGSYAKADKPNPAVGGPSSEIGVVGLGYEFGPFALRSQYGNFKSEYVGNTAGSNVRSWGIGLDWKTSVANKVNLSCYDAKDVGPRFGGKTTEIALLDTYSLSKTTRIYGQLVDVKAASNAGYSAAIGGATYTPSGALTASAGVSTVYFGIGMNHSF